MAKITRTFVKSKDCKHSVQFSEESKPGQKEACKSLYVMREVLKPGSKHSRFFNKSKDCVHSVQFKEEAHVGQPSAIGSLYLQRDLDPRIGGAASVEVELTVVDADTVQIAVDIAA